MSVPVWTLLGFATWTVLLLLATVGVYRWSRILTGRVPIREFRADRVELHRRRTGGAAGVESAIANGVCVSILAARVLQSLTHVSFVQTNTVASVRFTFFFVQILAFLALIAIVVDRSL